METKDKFKTTTTHAYSKAHKLTTAVYLVTNNLQNEESMKWKLRDTALSVLASTHEERTCLGVLHELELLLATCKTARVVSRMNAQILIEECGALARALKDQHAKRTQEERLLEEIFLVPDENEKEEQQQQQGGDANEQLQKDTHTQNDTQEQNDTKTTLAPRTSNVSAGDTQKPARTPVSSGSAGRQKVIRNIIREAGESTINDIKKHITDCSTKTLQRDLKALIKKGDVIRQGTRRWATYLPAH